VNDSPACPNRGAEVWCRDHAGQEYDFDAWVEAATRFHGYAAPGLVIGGRMVSVALDQLPPGILFDALCETAHCLPDAVQLLTPCTLGNGWLRLADLGRFALTLYDKRDGRGVRVAVDAARLDAWPQIRTWIFKLKPKAQQDSDLLREEIRCAGHGYLSVTSVRVQDEVRQKRHSGPKGICPGCGEGYPTDHGALCRACQVRSPYIPAADAPLPAGGPDLRVVPLEQAVGRRALHDMTRIVPGKSKGPALVKGQQIAVGDLCRLQQMGRRHVYVDGDPVSEDLWIHEDAAATAFGRCMAGENVRCSDPPREGKVTLLADRDGMLLVDVERLESFNLIEGVMCASRKGYSLVKAGDPLAGTRAIPLYLQRSVHRRALDLLEAGPLFRVLPLVPRRVGVLVTGSEVFQGLVQDRFLPLIRDKVAAYGCPVVAGEVVPDDRAAIGGALGRMLEAGAELLVTTGGLSVDPDDLTRQALADAGAQDLRYGAPILPGAMTLLARIGTVPLIGVPACGLYFAHTSFDLILPRLLAGVAVTRRDLARLGHGAFCLECEPCRFPQCSFGQ
jgi:formylmethanofuran dehydrogenase subunit E